MSNRWLFIQGLILGKILDVDFKNRCLNLSWEEKTINKKNLTMETIEHLTKVIDNLNELLEDENEKKSVAMQFGILARKLKYYIEKNDLVSK